MIRSLLKLCFSFTTLLTSTNCAAIGMNEQIRAAGGVPGPPGQASQAGEEDQAGEQGQDGEQDQKNPKEGGQEVFPSIKSYPTTSVFVAASTPVQQPLTTTPKSKTSTSSVVIHPTSISTSSTTPALSSSFAVQDFMSGTTTFPLLPSASPSTTIVSESVVNLSSLINPGPATTLSSTTVIMPPSKWPATSLATSTSMPTNIVNGTPSQSPDNRQLRIILPTVLLTIAFALASFLLLTRCCTTKPRLPPLGILRRPRAILRISDEEIPPTVFGKSQEARSLEPKPNKAVVSSILAAVSRTFTRKSAHSGQRPTFPTQTAKQLPIQLATTVPSPVLANSFFGITLPSTPKFPLFPFSPLRSHPPQTQNHAQTSAIANSSPLSLPPRLSLSFHGGSLVSLAASSSASSKSSGMDGTGTILEKTSAMPARFTFGGGASEDGVVRGELGIWWRTGQEGARRSAEMEKTGTKGEDRMGT